jgi:hypothetical protein
MLKRQCQEIFDHQFCKVSKHLPGLLGVTSNDLDFFSKIHEVIHILGRLPGVGYTGESIRKS